MPRHPHEPITPTLPFPPMPPAPPCGCTPPRMRPEPFSPGGLPAPHGFDFGRWAREKIGWLMSLVPSAASPDNPLADREWVAGQVIGGKADKVADATEGNLAALTQDGNLADSGTKPADFATAAQGAKADTAVQPAAIAGFVDGAEYDAEYGDPPKPTILLKHGSEVVATVDAADFIIDGMVSNVEVKNGNLVITFNTDSGKQPISIPLTDIFNPDNYYTKTDVNGLLAGKASTAAATLTEGYSEWVIDVQSYPDGYTGHSELYRHPVYDAWRIDWTGGPEKITTTFPGTADSLSLSVDDSGWFGHIAFSATRHPILTLGSQSDKPIQPAGDYLAKEDVVAPSNTAVTGQAADARATYNALADKLDKSGGTMTGVLDVRGQNLEIRVGPESGVDDQYARLSQAELQVSNGNLNDLKLAHYLYDRIQLNNGASSVTVGFPGVNGTLALTAGTGHANNLAALDAQGNPTDSRLSKDDVEGLFFAQYYPDGSVKSAAEFTPGIKYDDPDTVNRTITVKPFCNTGDSNNDNSSLVGRVVIPPFVDGNGNGHISDDGTRYKVVGVSNGLSYDYNRDLTAIVAPNTVTTVGVRVFEHCTGLSSISLPAVTTVGDDAFSSCDALTSISLPAATTVGDGAFSSCDALTSISLPAATTVGSYAFNRCTSLSAIDFGDTPRTSVPTLGTDAFYYASTSCKIIVPDAQYDEWIAAPNWSTLYADGYKFLKHSEWEAPRRYETENMMPLAWSDLKAMRDNGTLVPGQQYRITDYVATTSGNMDSRSANHPFDIIVTADAPDKLNEAARAVVHDGDLADDVVDPNTGERTKYFAGCNLAAWKLMYCLDNDTTRFAWAVADGQTDAVTSTGGRGVVYRMVDEFNNDFPYDFKGIQFQRWAITEITSTTLTADAVSSLSEQFVYSQNGNRCLAYGGSDISVNGTVMTVDASASSWYFTFDTGNGEDNSKNGYASNVYGNKAEEYVDTAKTRLNNIVFLGSGCYSNTFGNYCNSNTFGNYCYSNTFGNSCYSNTFGNSFYSNTFGNYCNSNTFGNSFYSNTFGNDFFYNTFGNSCYSNTFGNYCYSNTFGNSFYSNTFGNYCYSNTFGNDFFYNTFGNYCYSNTFGNDFFYNTFGNSCYSNTFGTGFVRALFSYSSSYNAGTYFRIQGVVYRMVAPYMGRFSNVTQFKVDDRLYSAASRTYYKCVVAHRGAWDDSHFEEVPQFGEGGVLVEDSTAVKSFYRYITFQSGIQYVALNCPNATSSAYYQNVELKSGVAGSQGNPKLITDTNANQDFHTTYQPADSQVISV